MEDVTGIVERLWPGRDATVEPLGGGITNHNFKVTVGGEAFVLRIGGKDTELLGIDRGHEHEATRAAAALGVGPEVIAFRDGCLVTRFVAGKAARLGEVPPKDVGALLRRVHGGPPIPGRFDSFRIVETYRDTAAGRGVAIPAAYDEASRRAGEIELRRTGVELRPCHNDLLSANFVGDGVRLWIVDWEYAGMGDPFFDLGNFAANHELDENGERALLAGYRADESGNDSQREVETDSDSHSDLAALRDMRFMSDFREAMWGVVQQAISDLDFDFVGYAEQHFERALR